MDKETEISKQMKTLRKMRGLTQEDLAKKVGISTMSIRRYENGERIMPLRIARGIAKALDVDTIIRPELSKNSLVYKALKKRLNDSFDQLSGPGQAKAVERVEELTEIPKYQKKPSSDESEDG